MMKTQFKLGNEMKEYLKMKNRLYIEKCLSQNKIKKYIIYEPRMF